MIIQPLSNIHIANGSPNATTVQNATLVYCVHGESSPSMKRFVHVIDPIGKNSPYTPMAVGGANARTLVSKVQVGRNVPVVIKKDSRHQIYASIGIEGKLGGSGNTGVTFTKIGYAS